MVPRPVSAGDVKLRVVMLCNVMMDQMFLDGHGFVRNSKEKEKIENFCILNDFSCASP